jgi:hypothetical protein
MVLTGSLVVAVEHIRHAATEAGDALDVAELGQPVVSWVERRGDYDPIDQAGAHATLNHVLEHGPSRNIFENLARKTG